MIWTRDLLEKLKKQQAAAVDKKLMSFTFEGQEVLVAYAKYLIEYLEVTLKPQGVRR